MPEFIKYLRRESLFFLFAGTLLAVVTGVVSWPLFLYALDAYDSIAPIRESEAFGMVVATSSLSLVVFLVLFLRVCRKKPSPEEVARQVETANPELRDLLNCAVELQEKSRHGELTYMENRVVRRTEDKAKEIAWGDGTRPRSRFWAALAAGFVIGGVLSAWGIETSPFQKTFDALSDEPGLTLFTTKTVAAEQTQYPASHEFSRGTDVSIFADVTRGHRGEKSAFIEFEEEGKIERIEMVSTPTLGRFEFVASSLQEPFEYRVVTPTLDSRWETLSPFDPPALVQAKWTIIPPAYLKMDSLEHLGFGYLRAPEGSILQLELEVEKSPERVGSTIHGLESNVTLDRKDSGVFSYSIELGEEWTGRLSLTDLDAPERGSVLYDEFVFAPIPDEPPLVEITEPAKDLQLPADANLLIEVFASDDHGVADVRINVSHAGEKEEETLFVKPVEKEKSLSYILDLSERALAVGDVITYMALAMDNKEPEGQLARSEIYFIEILPPEGNTTDGEGEGEQKEIPVRDFINKTKKIIRMTYDAMLEDELEQEKSALAIGSNALGLKHAMTKVYDENEGQFPIVDGIDLGELLNEATYHIEQTEIYAGDQMLEESLEPSEKTLRKLVQLYALMRKMQKMKSKGNGKPKESEETAANEKQDEDGEEPKDPAEELRQLGKDLEKLEEFEERQKDLNLEIGRSAGSGKTGEPNKQIAREQEELRRELGALRDEWYEKSGSLGEVGSLDAAGTEMKEAAGDLRRDEPREARPHGDLAAEALANAITAVEGKMAGLAAGMVDQLSAEAGGLASGQRDLAGDTEKAKPGQGESLKGEQNELNEKAKELLEAIDQAARAMGNFNENATEDLLKGVRDSREDGLERSGKRASNSLLYEAFPQAKSEEDKVAGNLENLQKELQGVADKLRNLGNSALRDLVEKLRETQEEIPGMGEGELKENTEELAKALGGLPNAETDERLLNLTRALEQVPIMEDSSQAKSLAAAAVAEALELVEQFFWQEAVENRLRRNQETTAAPSRYKRQVEEYFRRIAEGE
jgi:hypothetical protein